MRNPCWCACICPCIVYILLPVFRYLLNDYMLSTYLIFPSDIASFPHFLPRSCHPFLPTPVSFALLRRSPPLFVKATAKQTGEVRIIIHKKKNTILRVVVTELMDPPHEWTLVYGTFSGANGRYTINNKYIQSNSPYNMHYKLYIHVTLT